MTLTQALSLTITGLANGALYALVLSGILLVYQASKIMNFAHGQFGMLAAFGGYYLFTKLGIPVGVAIAIGLAAAIVVAGATERVLRRIPDAASNADVMI